MVLLACFAHQGRTDVLQRLRMPGMVIDLVVLEQAKTVG